MADVFTQVTYFRFGTRITSGVPCTGDIRAGAMDLSYKLEGEDEVTLGGGPSSPIPPPPAAEPALGPAIDPVRLLTMGGWRPGRPAKIMWTILTRPASRPHSGWRACFEKLKLSFVFPAFCRCVEGDTEGSCRVARLQLRVDYDGSTHPAAKLTRSRVSSNCPAYMQLDPTEEVVTPAVTTNARIPVTDCLPDVDDIPDFLDGTPELPRAMYANRDALGDFQNEFSWSVPLPCFGVDMFGNEARQAGECRVAVRCVYNYRTLWRA